MVRKNSLDLKEEEKVDEGENNNSGKSNQKISGKTNESVFYPRNIRKNTVEVKNKVDEEFEKSNDLNDNNSSVYSVSPRNSINKNNNNNSGGGSGGGLFGRSSHSSTVSGVQVRSPLMKTTILNSDEERKQGGRDDDDDDHNNNIVEKSKGSEVYDGGGTNNTGPNSNQSHLDKLSNFSSTPVNPNNKFVSSSSSLSNITVNIPSPLSSSSYPHDITSTTTLMTSADFDASPASPFLSSSFSSQGIGVDLNPSFMSSGK
jgi:hypothetical protein